MNMYKMDHTTTFAPTLKCLTEFPIEFRTFQKEWGYRNPNGTEMDRCNLHDYWFSIVLADTPYSNGAVNLAGWNSQDDVNKAREQVVERMIR